MPLYVGGQRLARVYWGGVPIARTYKGVGKIFDSAAICDCSPNYATGDRGSTIVVTTTALLHASSGPISRLIDGSMVANSSGSAFFENAQSVAGLEIKFQFAQKTKVTEARWIQSTTGSHGVWRWQGSDSGLNWKDIGSPFHLGASGTQVHAELDGNTKGYFYYRLFGVSGTTSWNPWIQECEFKQCAC